MLITLILLIILILAIIVLLKMGYHLSKAVIWLIILIGLILLYFSISNPLSSEGNIQNSSGGIFKSILVYFNLIGQTLNNFWDAGTKTASLVGDVVRYNETNGSVGD